MVYMEHEERDSMTDTELNHLWQAQQDAYEALTSTNIPNSELPNQPGYVAWCSTFDRWADVIESRQREDDSWLEAQEIARRLSVGLSA